MTEPIIYENRMRFFPMTRLARETRLMRHKTAPLRRLIAEGERVWIARQVRI